jgi:hypothetical protein
MLYYKEALILHEHTRDRPRRIPLLIRGARHWRNLLTQGLHFGDLVEQAGEFHEHFRLLARCLIEESRYAEAFAAFEIGHALAHATTIHPQHIAFVQSASAFTSENDVPLEVCRRIQDQLADDEVALLFVVLPPEFGSFLVSRKDIAYTHVPVVARRRAALLHQLARLPEALAAG